MRIARSDVVVAVLCLPSVMYAFILAIDASTRALLGRALTATGFWGNLVGLVGLFGGVLSAPGSVAACAVWLLGRRKDGFKAHDWIVAVVILGSLSAAVHFVSTFM